MNKYNILCTKIIVMSLDVKKHHFIPREEDEEILGPEVSYLSAIVALMC
jgi:hypothetical protein